MIKLFKRRLSAMALAEERTQADDSAFGSRTQMVLATGLLAAVLDPQRTLARQRWPWDASRDLRR